MAWTRLPSFALPHGLPVLQVSRLSLSACACSTCNVAPHARMPVLAQPLHSGAAELRVPCVSDTQKETAPEGAVSDLHSPP